MKISSSICVSYIYLRDSQEDGSGRTLVPFIHSDLTVIVAGRQPSAPPFPLLVTSVTTLLHFRWCEPVRSTVCCPFQGASEASCSQIASWLRSHTHSYSLRREQRDGSSGVIGLQRKYIYNLRNPGFKNTGILTLLWTHRFPLPVTPEAAHATKTP